VVKPKNKINFLGKKLFWSRVITRSDVVFMIRITLKKKKLSCIINLLCVLKGKIRRGLFNIRKIIFSTAKV